MAEDSNTIKVVVLGSGYQGKSALIIRFVSGIFVTEYDPTIEDNYRKLIVVDDEPVLLEILDTAGQDEYASMSEQWIEEGQIFILLYSVNSEVESSSPDIFTPYDNCRYLRDKIIKIKGDENTPMIVVGTKCDIPSEQRTFSFEDGEILSNEFKCPYIEVSAKNNNNLEKLWNEIVRVNSEYICSLGKDYKFSLQSDGKSIRGSIIGENNCCCDCLNSMKIKLKSMKSSDKINDMISPSNSSPFGAHTIKNENKTNSHTRVATESEMVGINGIGIENMNEKEILNALDDVVEEEEEEETKETDMKEEKEQQEQEQEESRVYIPKLSIGSDLTHKDRIKLFPVHKLPNDSGFEPILSCKYFQIAREFYFKRFIISIFCGIFLPIIILLQTIAFLLYIESINGGWYYPLSYKYNKMHNGILFDFMGLIIGRKPNQDPEIKPDRKWFLRQNLYQKIKRIILTIIICILYLICIHNIYFMKTHTVQSVSLMETIGPLLLYCVIWILLSLWIAYESRMTPHLPPLTRLRSINLYFGYSFDCTTSAYKFLRGYLSSIDKHSNLSLNYLNVFITIIIGCFYGCIPGITRLLIGDSSDGLNEKKFLTYNDALRIQIGALICNSFLIIAMIYTIQVQYKKYMQNYKEWMYILTMFLMSSQSNKEDTNQLDDDFDDDISSYSNENENENENGKYFPKNLFLSLERKSNVLGWLEIHSFLGSQGKLFFAEQELPILWTLIITCSLTMFILYRVFFVNGNPIQSVLFNGVSILTLICLIALIRIMCMVYQFNTLQIKQQLFIEMQQFIITCKKDESVNNMHFINQMLTLIKRKNIYPKLYEIKLNMILIPVIAGVVISAIVILLKLFVADLLF